jgi:hypothetical protein
MSEQAADQTASIVSTAAFSASEWSALRALAARYRENRDLFSARELDLLRFLRWLYHTGRVVP